MVVRTLLEGRAVVRDGRPRLDGDAQSISPQRRWLDPQECERRSALEDGVEDPPSTRYRLRQGEERCPSSLCGATSKQRMVS
jgi:hypothetical protein